MARWVFVSVVRMYCSAPNGFRLPERTRTNERSVAREKRVADVELELLHKARDVSQRRACVREPAPNVTHDRGVQNLSVHPLLQPAQLVACTTHQREEHLYPGVVSLRAHILQLDVDARHQRVGTLEQDAAERLVHVRVDERRRQCSSAPPERPKLRERVVQSRAPLQRERHPRSWCLSSTLPFFFGGLPGISLAPSSSPPPLAWRAPAGMCRAARVRMGPNSLTVSGVSLGVIVCVIAAAGMVLYGVRRHKRAPTPRAAAAPPPPRPSVLQVSAAVVHGDPPDSAVSEPDDDEELVKIDAGQLAHAGDAS